MNSIILLLYQLNRAERAVQTGSWRSDRTIYEPHIVGNIMPKEIQKMVHPVFVEGTRLIIAVQNVWHLVLIRPYLHTDENNTNVYCCVRLQAMKTSSLLSACIEMFIKNLFIFSPNLHLNIAGSRNCELSQKTPNIMISTLISNCFFMVRPKLYKK